MQQALYVAEGDRFVPTPATRGPWDPDAQHGGAVAALLAGAVERVEAPVPHRVVRLTYDLLRPVPLTPLSLRVQTVRPGKRVSIVAAALVADEVTVARVAALRVRTAALDLPETVAAPDDPPPGPPGTGELTTFGSPGAFNEVALEVRMPTDHFRTPGPGTAWARLRIPVVAGEEPTPLVRLAAASDLGNGVSWVLHPRDWLYLNPDLTVHVSRLPAGEWVGLRSTTFLGDDGSGFAESALYDETGRIGRATQSLYVDRRG